MSLPARAESKWGFVQTGSAFREGILPSLLLSTPVHAQFERPTWECKDPQTGKVVEGQQARPAEKVILGDDVTAPYGFTGPGLRPGEYTLGLVEAIRLRGIERKFGRSFMIDGVQGWERQVRERGEIGRATKTVRYTLRFELCPRAGRDVNACNKR